MSAEAARHGRPRVLFSAQGLPEKIVKAGEPYQWQCDRTAEALAEARVSGSRPIRAGSAG
jgi:ferrochelatase